MSRQRKGRLEECVSVGLALVGITRRTHPVVFPSALSYPLCYVSFGSTFFPIRTSPSTPQYPIHHSVTCRLYSSTQSQPSSASPPSPSTSSLNSRSTPTSKSSSKARRSSSAASSTACSWPSSPLSASSPSVSPSSSILFSTPSCSLPSVLSFPDTYGSFVNS